MVIKVSKGLPPESMAEDKFVKGAVDSIGLQRRPLEALPLNCEIFELTEVGASHWLEMDRWTMQEAALLLSGANPKCIAEFDKDPNVPSPDYESCGYVGIWDRLTRASEVGVLTFPASPSDVCCWAAKKHGIPKPLLPAVVQVPRTPVSYSYLLHERIQPRTKWRGGRITDVDVLTLDEAARMASKHAGEDVTVADFLRAAGRGEITLRAIVHRSAKVRRCSGGICCNKGTEDENVVPGGSIPTLPLTACQHLATGGRASWRTFDGFETINGTLMRFTKAMLTDDEPDFETVSADCRVTGNDVHALADAFRVEEPEAAQAAVTVPAEQETLPAEPQWQEQARTMALSIIERDQAKSLFPSQHDIADEIARRFRDSGIVGAGGKPLSGAYIKRHALKGISSAQGKQLSTSIRQGK